MGKADYYMIEDLPWFSTVEYAEKYIAWLNTLPQDNEQVQRAMQHAQKVLAAAREHEGSAGKIN